MCVFICALLAASETHAQLMLPGAAPAAPQGSGPAPTKPKPAGAPSQGAGASLKSAKAPAAPSMAGLVGRPLLLNGKSGLLQISGDDKMVTIDKLQLAGEGVSDPSQRCVVDIVGEKPIEATNIGRPDGLERFEADIPACPISFDILDGAALVPSQITACVFKAADCQTSPGGLWGPDGSSLADAATIVKERAQAEKAMAKVLQAIQNRAGDSPAAANLVRDQTAFAGQRDDACRDYVKESLLGYCALRLTEARTALLETRLDEIRGAGAAKAATDKGKKTKPKQKPAADAAGTQ
jgi:uncharacterized protein YecT (DUF1311 family)